MVLMHHLKSTVGGYPKNPDEFPEHGREKEQLTRSGAVMKRKETEILPQVAQIPKECESPYTCPRTAFYRETNGLLHSENTLELEEYS
jgi:hypothetical protein